MTIPYSIILATMLFASGMALAQTNSADATLRLQAQDAGKKMDVEWMSYRDAYKTMIQFQKYGKPKQLIQNHFQVSYKSGQVLPEGLQLKLVSKSMHLNLPLDVLGRASFPLLKSAYDENAELTVNQSAGDVFFQSRISILPRSDGIYEVSELRNACEQARAFLQSVGDIKANGKNCVGVRFSYPKNIVQPELKWREPDAQLRSLNIQDGSAFQDELANAYKIANFRFSDGSDKGHDTGRDKRHDQGQILSPQAPIAIAPLFE